MKFQEDGTTSAPPRPMSEEERRWLEDALRGGMIDLGKRMHEIKATLESQVTEEDIALREQILDELIEIVESIDHARDLATIGGLGTLLDLMASPYPSLRWRAAEVVATCVQNNADVQEHFMQGGVLPPLLALLQDDDALCRTKALLAMSCMLRGYGPAQLWLREHDFIVKLCSLLSSADSDPRPKRKCLRIVEYWMRTLPQDARAVMEGGIASSLAQLVLDEDNDVREGALAVTLELISVQSVKEALQGDAGLQSSVNELGIRLDALGQDDWASVRDEVELIKRLQKAFLEPEHIRQAQGRTGSELQIVSVPT